MENVIVRYTVRPDAVQENEKLIAAVFAGLNECAPEGVHYAAFKEEDGKSFVHVASFENDEMREKFTGSDSFKAFTADIKGRCETPPAATKLTLVQNYNLV